MESLFFVNDSNLSNLLTMHGYPLTPIHLELSSLTREENEELSSKLNRFRNECGCSSGSYYMMAGIIIVLLGYFIGSLNFSWPGAGYGVLIIFIFGMVGKTISLMIARLRYKRLLRHLIDQEQKAVASQPQVVSTL